MRESILSMLAQLLPSNLSRRISAADLRSFFTQFIDSFLLIFTGDWNADTTYKPGDVAMRDGTSYRCKLQHTNQVPPNATYWDVVAKAVPGPKGDTGAVGPAGTTNPTNNYLPVRAGTGVFGDSLLQQVDELTRKGVALPGNKQYLGAAGAVAIGGDTISWNDGSMARQGYGHYVLLGSNPNGPGGGLYYYSLGVTNSGDAGYMTQFAIPYYGGDARLRYRICNAGTWSSWKTLVEGYEIMIEPNGSNKQYNLRRPYKFTWASVQNDGVTIGTQPASSVNANTDAFITLSGTAGKTLTIVITPIY